MELWAGLPACASAPHQGQCFIPMKMAPKQEAHTSVARLEWQYAHRTLSGAAAAPQFGQL